MNDELKTECMELCVTACEKFSQNNEVRRVEKTISFSIIDFDFLSERRENDQRNDGSFLLCSLRFKKIVFVPI